MLQLWKNISNCKWCNCGRWAIAVQTTFLIPISWECECTEVHRLPPSLTSLSPPYLPIMTVKVSVICMSYYFSWITPSPKFAKALLKPKEWYLLLSMFPTERKEMYKAVREIWWLDPCVLIKTPPISWLNGLIADWWLQDSRWYILKWIKWVNSIPYIMHCWF